MLDRARDEGRVLVTADHDFVQTLFASGDASPSLVLVGDVEALWSPELAGTT
jgi:predicted nuclease of predicted toxin-antitoxin system